MSEARASWNAPCLVPLHLHLPTCVVRMYASSKLGRSVNPVDHMIAAFYQRADVFPGDASQRRHCSDIGSV